MLLNIGIIGGGSVGLLMAAYFGRKHEVHVYTKRSQQAGLLNESGVYCDVLGQVNLRAHLFGGALHKHDVLFVTVKQQQLSTVLDLLEELSCRIPVVFLQNGMGHLELLPKKIYPVYLGVVEHGAKRASDTKVLHTGRGRVKVAAYKAEQSAEWIADLLHEEDFPFQAEGDYFNMLVSKLMVNTVINPLTAIFRVQNKFIVKNTELRSLASKLCREASQVFQRSYEEEWEHVLRVAEQTGDNYSSMLTDLSLQRKTEIDYISGYVLKKSVSELPYHQFVVRSVHALEQLDGEGGRV
ncbi:2-dehydropantoate 2-reductase [Halobacillus salinarum]|uniref:2-dehydropantoate 2-reductase n=1 Tax=Halobacillus salinarum TaxID=2932257 RepID=A0ABY4EGY6_9BACI|nr:2-dehydropantoate 2-reductase [Halobacillus salinarum]UOQ43143.1 2-dehydropantoate 2-reductase [Halobacillus salinarum]